MKMKQLLCNILLMAVILLGMMPVSSYAAGEDDKASHMPVFSDMPDNWSTTALQNAVANGLLVGSNGKIMPNAQLTRAEMAAMIVRVFGANVEGDLKDYSDADTSVWYAKDMAKAYQMGVIQGSGGQMKPNDAITREEVIAILARAFKFQPASTIETTFADVNEISDWAKGSVYAIVNAGYIHGADGKLSPKAYMTRAEFA